MCAGTVTLKAVRSEVHYRGNYAENAFGLLAPPIPLYRNLLKHLPLFGATLQSLKLETPSLAESHVICVLAELNTAIVIHLDRIIVDFWRLHEIGSEIANKILLGACAALVEAQEGLSIPTHVVEVNTFAEVQGGTAADVLARYVRLQMF